MAGIGGRTYKICSSRSLQLEQRATSNAFLPLFPRKILHGRYPRKPHKCTFGYVLATLKYGAHVAEDAVLN